MDAQTLSKHFKSIAAAMARMEFLQGKRRLGITLVAPDDYPEIEGERLPGEDGIPPLRYVSEAMPMMSGELEPGGFYEVCFLVDLRSIIRDNHLLAMRYLREAEDEFSAALKRAALAAP